MGWIKQLFSRRQMYGDLSEEIQEHLDEKIEELVASGMSRKEAAAAARREFGNVTLVQENSREIWRWPSWPWESASIRRFSPSSTAFCSIPCLHDVVPSAMSRRRKMRGRPSIDYLIGGKAMAAPGTHVGSSGKTEPPASNDKRWR